MHDGGTNGRVRSGAKRRCGCRASKSRERGLRIKRWPNIFSLHYRSSHVILPTGRSTNKMLIVDARTGAERGRDRALFGRDILHVPFPMPGSLLRPKLWLRALNRATRAVQSRLKQRKGGQVRHVAVYCKKGIRSARVTSHLAAALGPLVRVVDWGGVDDPQSIVSLEWEARMKRAWESGGGSKVWSAWFGRPTRSAAKSRMHTLWFPPRGSEEQKASDAYVKRHGLHILAERAARGELNHWVQQPHGNVRLLVAWVILRDQIPRHVHRGTPKAFILDSQNVKLLLEYGLPRNMPWIMGRTTRTRSSAYPHPSVWEVGFALMPFQHHENKNKRSQDKGTELHKNAIKYHPSWTPSQRSRFEVNFLEHQRIHRSILARFGRFPSRNRALGRRVKSRAESEFLKAFEKDTNRHV